MYRRLDGARIVETLERLRQRIAERFPGSGLERVSGDLLGAASESMARLRDLRRPNVPLRIATWALIAIIVFVAAEALLHLRLEDAEAGLLPHVEHLIDGVVGLADVGVRLLLEIAQLFHPLLHLRLVRLLRQCQPAQILQDPVAILLRLAAHVLERLELNQELRELIVADLQRVLRLEQRVGVEHAPHFGRRDVLRVRRRGGGRLALPALLALRRLRRRAGRRREHGDRCQHDEYLRNQTSRHDPS